MKLDGEEVEPVLRFEDLKEGMIIRVLCCGTSHRNQVIRLMSSWRDWSGAVVIGPCWEVVPPPRCLPAHIEPACLAAGVYWPRGKVFRVVDGLDPAADAEQARQDRITADVRRAIHVARDQLAGRFR